MKNVAVFCDCCSGEMEAYWAEVAEEMGIKYNDYGHDGGNTSSGGKR